MKALVALATGLLVVGTTPVWADAPTRTAWYSAATAGPVTLPAPTLAEGDLRVAGTGERPTAYASLAFASPGTDGGELVLAVRSGSLGTVELAACPTRATDWQAGGNQPFEAGPEYDCAAGAVFGSISADGTSVSFALDSSVQPAAGTLSIAIAPLPEAEAPFSVDLGDPQYTPAGGAQEPVPQTPAEPGQAPAPTGTAVAPPLAPDSALPPPDGSTGVEAPAPALADVLAPPAAPEAPAPGPELAAPADPGAPAAAPGAPVAVLPGAQLAAGGSEAPAGPRLLALLTLVGVSAGAGYAAGQQRPAPRLLGGRARALPAGAPVPGAALAVPTPEPGEQPRGIGRFSRVRDAAPRRLR